MPRAGVGLYDIPACVQAFIRHKLVKAKASDATVRSLVAERTRLTKTRADAAEVEVRKLTGELVPVPTSKPHGSASPAPCARGCC